MKGLLFSFFPFLRVKAKQAVGEGKERGRDMGRRVVLVKNRVCSTCWRSVRAPLSSPTGIFSEDT